MDREPHTHEVIDNETHTIVGPVLIDKKVNENWLEMTYFWVAYWCHMEGKEIPSRGNDQS